MFKGNPSQGQVRTREYLQRSRDLMLQQSEHDYHSYDPVPYLQCSGDLGLHQSEHDWRSFSSVSDTGIYSCISINVSMTCQPNPAPHLQWSMELGLHQSEHELSFSSVNGKAGNLDLHQNELDCCLFSNCQLITQVSIMSRSLCSMQVRDLTYLV